MIADQSRRNLFKAGLGAGLLAALAARGAAGNPVAGAESRTPNVLFIAVDDWNDWVAAMGND